MYDVIGIVFLCAAISALFWVLDTVKEAKSELQPGDTLVSGHNPYYLGLSLLVVLAFLSVPISIWVI
ncbi:MAG: hypothetical protein ACI8Q1_003262 [Parvicella sp.]|jgi:hypothetical protein